MPSLTGVQTCARSEEHTSELQSLTNLVCRLLLEKKTFNNETRRVDSINSSLNLYNESDRIDSLNSSLSKYNDTDLINAVNFFFFKTGNPPNSTSFPPTPLFLT